MDSVDYIIVGQGLAGSSLAWQLLKRGASFVVVDDGHTGAASLAASGIINPITGQRLTPAWQFHRFYSEASTLYRQLESVFGDRYFYEMLVHRFIGTDIEFQLFKSRQEEPAFKQYINSVHEPDSNPGIFIDPYGSFTLTPAAYVNISKLINDLGDYLDKKRLRIRSRFCYPDLKLENSKVVWNNWTAERIIFFEGFQVLKNPWFKDLPFKPARGEVLLLESDEPFNPNTILNRGKWLLPLGAKHYMAGATYSWHSLDHHPSENGKNEIIQGLLSFIPSLKFMVKGHQVGVRPALTDSLPVIGPHAQFPQIIIFNGLGSKGALLAPFCVKVIIDYLISNIIIINKFNVYRFYE